MLAAAPSILKTSGVASLPFSASGDDDDLALLDVLRGLGREDARSDPEPLKASGVATLPFSASLGTMKTLHFLTSFAALVARMLAAIQSP